VAGGFRLLIGRTISMFFKNKSLGIDISDYSIEVISLEGPASEPRLLLMANALVEEGIFENGKIVKKDELKKTLKSLLRRPNFGRLETKKAVFALPEAETFILNLSLPAEIEKQEIQNFVRSQIEENFPYAPEDLYFDSRLNGEEVFIAASPKEIVNSYLEIIRSLNLKLMALEPESLSLSRTLIKEAKPILVVDIGAKISNFSLFDAGQLKMSFSLPIAGSNFTRALAEKLNLTLSKAEALKKKIGLNPKPEEGRVFLVLQKELSGLVEEMKKISNFFFEKTGKNLGKIILAGGSASLPRLPDYLKENLGVPIEICDPWITIDIGILKKRSYLEEARKINPVVYAPAIGAALRGIEKNPEKSEINLLPR